MNRLKDCVLSELPDYPALQQLGRALWRNGSIRGAALLVGAGFSKNAVVAGEDSAKPPLWNDLNQALVSELYPGAERHAPTDALRIAEEYRTYFGQAVLDDFIRKRFPDRAWSPGPLHTSLLALPWSDVLTTNWDTLLEKAAAESADSTYEVVRSESDLPHARAPRIVKLHGTIGDPEPLIFAEEDYRTYQVKHAAFVNLARQIFIENELCLLGFSGDDPNFLEWAGWVRDQLGGKARRIYLVGCLGLMPAKRKFLESLNIAPVDLAPAVNSLDFSQKHSVSAKIFFDALAEAKPHPLHEWTRISTNEYPLHVEKTNTIDQYQRARKDDEFAAAALEKTALILEQDRKCYPGWLICPSNIRSAIRHVNDEAWLLRAETLAKFAEEKRAKILFEFVWQRKTSFQPLGEKLRVAIGELFASKEAHLDEFHRREFVSALLRDIRVADDAATDAQLKLLGEQYGGSDVETQLEVRYQRCLLARDVMDYKLLLSELRNLKTDEPIWKLRSAALWSEVGHQSTASRLIADANEALDQAHRLDRSSLWIKSRLGWSNALCRMKDAARWDRNAEVFQAREFKELSIDPFEEINHFRKSAQEIQAKRYESAEITPLFNPGHYRESSKPKNGELDDSSHLNRYELDQLIEFAGIPGRLNHVDFVAAAMVSTAKVTYTAAFDWYAFLIRGLQSHVDKSFEKYFNRTAIARISTEASQRLIEVVRNGISFWGNRIKVSQGEDHKDDLGFAIDRLRLHVHVLARLSVRMAEHDAVKVFRLSIELATDPDFKHPWLLDAFGALGHHAVSAVSPNGRNELAIIALQFPLSSEHRVNARSWPNPATWLWHTKPNRPDVAPEWGVRVNQLLLAVEANGGEREEAAIRLAYLAVERKLTTEESIGFAKALWSITDGGELALPIRTGLLDSTFLELPSPGDFDIRERLSRRVFEQDLLKILPSTNPSGSHDVSDCHEHLLSMKNLFGLGLKVSPEAASRLFDQLVSWRKPAGKSDGVLFPESNHFHAIEVLVGDVLGHVIAPQLDKSAMSNERLTAYLECVTTSAMFGGMAGLVHFLEAFPDQLGVVLKIVDKGLASSHHSRVANAASAVVVWSKVAGERSMPVLPKILVDKLVMFIAMRHEHGLHVLLVAARALQKNGNLDESQLAILVDALGDLVEETKYELLDIESRKAVSNSLVRAECVKLAASLQLAGRSEQVISEWIEQAKTDPLPEVRFSLINNDEFEM
jgi:hypothetical protein